MKVKASICALLTMFSSLQAIDAIRFLDSSYPGHQIEWAFQNGRDESSPLIVILHGAQPGGLHTISESCWNYMREQGYTVATISMPGFGGTTGTRDFCGPFTTDTLNYAIDKIKEEFHVDSFGLVGFGQGAVVAPLLAAQRDDILCVLCSNGGYDLLRHKTPNNKVLSIIHERGYDVDIESEMELRIRSAQYFVDAIKAPIFLIHRKENPVITSDEVVDFYAALRAAGNDCRIALKEIGPGLDEQRISLREVIDEAGPWLHDHLIP